jgi:membrane-associated protein
MHALIDLFLHLDVHLAEITASYGVWIYAILFAIIFAETGLVVTPFLPGDSLLFACGALAATGVFNPLLTVVLLALAAIVGNTVNFSVGRYI